MKLYAVLFHWEDEFELEAVFSTRNKAEQYIEFENKERQCTENELWCEELELDKPKGGHGAQIVVAIN